MADDPKKGKTPVEGIKDRSGFLRGTIEEGLAKPLTGSIDEDDTQLTKFHGIYMQDDRDIRSERRKQKLEPAYSFMIRARVPGGVCTPAQWLAMDELARAHANGTLRLTTRQAFQFHGVLKSRLKGTVAGINETLLDTLAACGDVNRNVMCSPNLRLSRVHEEVYAWAGRISDHLTPKTSAYHEIWLDGKKELSTEESEPIYGKTYLPRKFKMGIVVPPANDIDVFTQDLGLIAIVEDGRLAGFNVTVGGGMGMSHGEPDTYPRLGDLIGFCLPEQAVEVSEGVVTVQRDFGDRSNRKHARLKYTIDDRGIDWFKAELSKRLGYELAPARPFEFESTGDRYGWAEDRSGRWHLTLFIENGRVADKPGAYVMTGLREVARVHRGDMRLTPNQNVIIANVEREDKPRIDALVRHFGLDSTGVSSRLRLNSMACVAFPTCGLAMAESERYLPDLVTRLEGLLANHGLENDPIVIRMTGCPNGCARPYVAEIGLVGKGPGKYNLYLGAEFTGRRLNKLYRENIGEDEIVAELGPLLESYARDRQRGEHFGDFLVRTDVVPAVRAGVEFHA